MVSLSKVAVAFLCGFYALVASIFLVPPALADSLAPLNTADRAEFLSLRQDIKRWNGDQAELSELKASVERFYNSHQDFVPIMVERSTVEWIRLSGGMGVVQASMSVLPQFLEYQKMDPAYSTAYLHAARAYIYTSDFEGALPSLRKATSLAPEDPWVELTWAFLADRKRQGKTAEQWAWAAIPKSKDDPIAMGNALAGIGKHYGITNADAVTRLAKAVCQVRCDDDYVAAVIAEAIEDYAYQPGLLDTVAVLSNLAAHHGDPSPSLLLEFSHEAILSGNLHQGNGVTAFDPHFTRSAKEILLSIKDDPSVSADAWGLLVDLALSEKALDEVRALIKQGQDRKYSEQKIGEKMVALLIAEGRTSDVVNLYAQLGLPEDSRLAAARAQSGDVDGAQMYYKRLADDNPTSPYIVGDYAGFLLFYLGDVGEAIAYGTQAYELARYPLLQQTLAAAYLSSSGQFLAKGNLDAALQMYESAQKVGYDRDYVRYVCWETCDEMLASLNAFDKVAAPR